MSDRRQPPARFTNDSAAWTNSFGSPALFLACSTDRADANENGVMPDDLEPTSLLGNVPRHQGFGHFDIDQRATDRTVDMVMSFAPAVIPAGLIGKRELLDETVLGQKVERAIDRSIPDTRIAPPHAFENLSGCQVAIGLSYRLENHCALRGLAKFTFGGGSSVHRSIPLTLQLRMSLVYARASIHEFLLRRSDMRSTHRRRNDIPGSISDSSVCSSVDKELLPELIPRA